MGIGWIAQHMLELHQHRPAPFPQHLCVKVKITWWKRFDVKFLEEKFRNWKNKSIAPPRTPKKLAQPVKENLKLKGKSKAEIRVALLEALSEYIYIYIYIYNMRKLIQNYRKFIFFRRFLAVKTM